MVIDHHHEDPEVVPWSNLEAVPYQLATSDRNGQHQASSVQHHAEHEIARSFTSDLKDAPRINNGHMRLIIFGGAILVAIVSGVVGGVVGWQVTEKRLSGASVNAGGGGGSTDADAGSGTSTSGSGRTCTINKPLISASVVRNGTALAATGWRYGTDHVIWVYFQGTDDSLQYVVYDTMYGAWAGPTMLSLDEGAVAGTALTATTLLWPEPQPQLVYQDISGTLKGSAWRLGWPSVGKSAMLNKAGFYATSKSALAGFIPSFYLQAGNGSVSETILNGTYTDLATLPISPASETPLLAIPRTKTHADNELRLFFRRNMDGKIAVFERDSNYTAAFATDGEPALPFGTVGEGSILAGFTTARSAGTSDLNTMILLQDIPSGDIKYTWTGDASGWQDAATDVVFEGADAGGVTCLTAATTWNGHGVKPLEVSDDMNKCYFLAEGKIKEVWWDGSSWTEVGFI
ncbi:hypothetical protein Daus18300_007310 [Diaporthe australafricana]|uniref:Fucose-specific lectin n=1 Tax=Diaporthe australafricana TaxID=127596 RepID=A0ABR3WNP1_9PEZI